MTGRVSFSVGSITVEVSFSAGSTSGMSLSFGPMVG